MIEEVFPIDYLHRDLKRYLLSFFDVDTLGRLSQMSHFWRTLIQNVSHQQLQREYPRLYRNLYSEIPGFSNWCEAYALARRKDEESIKDEFKARLFDSIRLNKHQWTGGQLERQFNFSTAVEGINVFRLASQRGFTVFLSEFHFRAWVYDKSISKESVIWAIYVYQPMHEIKRQIDGLESAEDFRQNCFNIAGIACDVGCVEALSYILEEKKISFDYDNCGTDPWVHFLFRACFYGHSNVVKYLLARPLVKKALAHLQGDTLIALEGACSNGDVEAVRALVDNGCVIDTPILLMKALEHESLSVLRYLVEETVLGNAVDGIDITRGYYWFWTVCREHHVAIVDYLIDRFGVNREFRGMTGLDNFCSFFAVEGNKRDLNHTRVAETLIRHGAIFKQYEDDHVTSGVAQLIRGKPELTQRVLEAYIHSLGKRHPFVQHAAKILLQVFRTENPTQEDFHKVEKIVKPFAQRQTHMMNVLYAECMRWILPKMELDTQFEFNKVVLQKRNV
jgi:hypothetical protein